MLDEVWEKLLWRVLGAKDLVDEGGEFVIWIFLCGVGLWALVIERYW